jgi:hypothetical protein
MGETMPAPQTKLFELGRIVVTEGALQATTAEQREYFLAAHARGNWGAVDMEQWHQNDDSLTSGKTLFSVYPLDMSSGADYANEFWIKTHGDRSTTTIMLPHEH